LVPVVGTMKIDEASMVVKAMLGNGETQRRRMGDVQGKPGEERRTTAE
jgi:hypothetical protein